MSTVSASFDIDLTDVVVLSYIFSLIFANGTILFYMSTLLLCIVTVANILISKLFIKKSEYITWFMYFIVYNIFLIIFGFAEFPLVSLERLVVVFFNYVVTICLFRYMWTTSNIKKLEIFYISSVLLFFVYLCISNPMQLLSGRLGDETNYLFGLEGVNGIFMNSNDVGRMIYVFVFMLFNYHFREKLSMKVMIPLILLSIFLAALTGSRATLMIVISYLMTCYYLQNKSLKTRIRMIGIGVIGIIVAFYLILNTEPLYTIIGQRIMILFDGSYNQLTYFNSMDGNSTYFRLMMFEQATEMILNRPLLGWGLFAYSQMDNAGTYSHSNILEILISCGLCGFIIYYRGLYLMLKAAYKERYYNQHYHIATSLFVFLAIILLFNTIIIDFTNRLALFEYVYIASILCVWNTKENGGENEKYRYMR